jgi:hypothetical protein
MFLVERNKYLNEVLGAAKSGWHAQILQTYDGLRKKGVLLPKVDLKSSSSSTGTIRRLVMILLLTTLTLSLLRTELAIVFNAEYVRTNAHKVCP